MRLARCHGSGGKAQGHGQIAALAREVDAFLGQTFADALIDAQRRGVQVNLIYDSVGSMTTPAAFFDQMTASGIAYGISRAPSGGAGCSSVATSATVTIASDVMSVTTALTMIGHDFPRVLMPM